MYSSSGALLRAIASARWRASITPPGLVSVVEAIPTRWPNAARSETVCVTFDVLVDRVVTEACHRFIVPIDPDFQMLGLRRLQCHLGQLCVVHAHSCH
ncbi:MAG: hypothetical protein QM328_05615 [Acidobacteriota bacterium]|nr:hypothetical protein [Acidobacteriota bacterium]